MQPIESKPRTSTGKKRTRNSPGPQITQPTNIVTVDPSAHKQICTFGSSPKKQKTVALERERAAISTANQKMVCPSCVCSSIRAEVISLVKEAENRVFSIITAQLRNKAVILKAYLERYKESPSRLQS